MSGRRPAPTVRVSPGRLGPYTERGLLRRERHRADVGVRAHPAHPVLSDEHI